MMPAAQHHNPHIDSVRTAYHAAVARQPVLPAADAAHVVKVLELARDCAREAYRITRECPQYAEQVTQAGRILAAVSLRIAMDRRAP